MERFESTVRVNPARLLGSVDDERVKAIAYGAVKYTMEKASNDKSVVFDWDKALCFEGKSGPYIHYCYARIQSLLRRCPELDLKNASYEECGIHEYMVAKLIAEFPNIVGRATIIMSPHLIANYLYELAKAFSSFYQKCSILNLPNDELRVARIKLVLAVKQVIENSFYLLGIETIDRM